MSAKTVALVLDGNQRSALAATRALGSRGVPVVVADESPRTLAGSSRYCCDTFTYPSPSTRPEAFIAALQRECAKRGVPVVLPMTDTTTYLLARDRDSLSGVRLPIGSFEALESLQDKWELWRLARDLDVPAPQTYAVGTRADLEQIAPTLRFPVVVKPQRSRAWADGRCVAGSVGYAYSVEELKAMIPDDRDLARRPFLLQEYVSGQGQGVFALYAHGSCVALFAHRRLREKPPSGGVSVLSESIALEPRLRDFTLRILDHVDWHGVAMLEFKVSPDGTPYLIEANPRFWGSLQLAIDAGVNFPYLLYQIAVGADPDIAAAYTTGVRSRWLLGDIDHLYLTLRGDPGPNLRRRSKWRAMAAFLRLFDRATRYDVNRRDDLRPFLLELRRYFRTAS